MKYMHVRVTYGFVFAVANMNKHNKAFTGNGLLIVELLDESL